MERILFSFQLMAFKDPYIQNQSHLSLTNLRV